MPICAVCGTKFYPQTRQEPAEDCDCGGNWQTSQCETESERNQLRDAMADWKLNQQITLMVTQKLTQATMVIIATVMALPPKDREEALEAAFTIIRKAFTLAVQLETMQKPPDRVQ